MKSFLFVLVLLISPVISRELIALYGDHDAPPYAIEDSDTLSSCIIRDILDSVAKELDITVEYKKVPRKRYVYSLESGTGHIQLISNPAWIENDSLFGWSVPLFQENNVIVCSSTEPFPVKSVGNLKGKSVGTILGYVYSDSLEEAFRSGDVIREDVRTVEMNFGKLALGRIDCFIDSDKLIGYNMKMNDRVAGYVVGEWIVGTYEIQGVVSPYSPIPVEEINRIIVRLKERGVIQGIISSYIE